MPGDDLATLSRKDVLAAAPRLDSRHYDPSGSLVGNMLQGTINRNAREQLLPWLLDRWKDQEALAFSLTFSANGHGAIGGAFRHDLSRRDDLQAIVRRLHRDISHAAYGHAARRYGRRLGFLAVWEGFQRRHPHCHGLLEICKSRPQFEQWVDQVFRSHPFVGEYDLQPCTDIRGWLRYLLKFRDKGELLQDIDWIACHVPGHRAPNDNHS